MTTATASGATIVTAFMCAVNTRTDRSSEKYIELGKALLSIPVRKIVFLDEPIFSLLEPEFGNENTKIVRYLKSSMYLNEHREKITVSVETKTPEKDSLDYIFTMCNKTEFIRKAIEIDADNHQDQYVWIDFGIKHVLSVLDSDFKDTIISLSRKSYPKVRIASIWNPQHGLCLSDQIYKRVFWYFAGGVFGGNKKSLICFADLVKDKILSIIEAKHTLVWEVNVWALVYAENKDLFDPYQSDHNDTIISHY